MTSTSIRHVEKDLNIDNHHISHHGAQKLMGICNFTPQERDNNSRKSNSQ